MHNVYGLGSVCMPAALDNSVGKGIYIQAWHLAQRRPVDFQRYSDSSPYACDDDVDGPDVGHVPLVKIDSTKQTVCMQWYTLLLSHQDWQKRNPETNDP